MKKRTPFALVIFLLLASALACSLTSGTGSKGATGTNEDAPSPGESTGEEGNNAGQGADVALFAPVPSGLAIVQTTPESGNGTHPVFAWQAVDGAARYMLFVVDAKGYGYWSWEGSATSVILGGFDAPPPDTAEGPRLTGPLQWAVVALDANDSFIASSPLRPVAP